MSQWDSGVQGNQPSSSQGQVMFYDPTKFQKGPTDFPAVSSSAQQNHSEPTSTAGFYNDQGANAATSNSWNSWGAWDPNSAAYNNLGQVPADGNQVASDSNVYNQQWYGQNQWDTSQLVWDPNTEQLVPNQFNYQHNDPNYQQGGVNYQQGEVNYQQGQENQFGGYNQYWTGEAAMNGQNNMSYNNNFHSVHAATGHGAQQSDFGTHNFSNQNTGLVSGDNLQQPALGAPIEGEDIEDTDEHTEDNTEELDESQLTEPTTETESNDNQSLNRSLGNYEEGYLDGYVQNEEVIHENESTSVETVDQVAESGSNFVENSSNNGAAMSGRGSSGFDISGQMQALNLQENVQHEHIPSDHSVEQTNIYNPNPGQISYQQQLNSVPFMPEASLNTGNPPQSDTVTLSNTTEPVMSFSDWEMVPPTQTVVVPTISQEPQVPLSKPQAAPAPSHSRNTSIDDNVHFFIGSNASSTRVSPAQSTKTDDGSGSQRSGVSNSAGQTGDIPVPDVPWNKVQAANQRQEPVIAVSEEMLAPVIASSNSAPPPPDLRQLQNSQSHPPVQAPPPNTRTGPPPIMSGSAMGGNPYRKSPLTDSIADNSVLSSTRLDVTKPNSENSPVVLNQSISPIPSDHINDKPDSNAEADPSKSESSVVDTPRTSGGQKSTRVPESPVMPRKESPFQPPGRSKPLKASHDIKVSANSSSDADRGNLRSRRNPDNARNGLDRLEKSGDRQNPDEEVSRRSEGRRTPDWDSRCNEGRRTPDWDRKRSDRGYGRRTPDWDSRDDRHSRDPERERYRRYGDEDHGDRVMSRPPRPGNGNDRGHSFRPRQSAFHQIQTNRSKNNVSPATSLWDTPDNLSTVSNILLVPQSTSGSGALGSQGTTAPSVLTPVASLITSMSEHIKTEDSDPKGKDQDVNKQDHSSQKETKDRTKDRQTDRGGNRDVDDRGLRGNRSYESLRDRERSFKDSRNNSREKLSMYSSRNSLDQDDPRERSRRGDSRERDRGHRDKDHYSDRYRDRDRDRDRPPSRNGSTVDGYSRRDYRDRDSYREREYYSRKYERDRPRSRQGDRPSSGQGEGERPRSRGGDYDRDSSYYRDKYRSGYEYDDYYRRGGHYYDSQYYHYYYGNYSQAGYYDEHGYYHSDPRYHYDYYQRRSRTGTPGSLSDGGEEISKIEESSNKSDKNGERKRFDYPPELHEYSHRSHYGDYYGYYDYDQSQYRWDPHISQWVANTATEVEPQRQTPEKFMYPHVRAAFGPNGQLVKVLPNGPADGQPATIEIHDVQTLLEDNEESEELRAFPGPLVRGDTHKNDVLLFCQQKAQACQENMELEDRESAELIWRFLELLIKQNGTVVGTDIADLLLKGHEPTTLEYKRTGMKIAASSDNLEIDEEGSEGRLSRGTTPVDRSMLNKGRSVDEVTDRFRHLLLYGRKKDAIDWAMKNNLWGHALFLASKMDTRMHANVMTRFANVAMRMNDPLQTLYQLMSGRQPAAVTSVGEERWGDWRPHLAMILANHSNKPDLDRKSITQLGDTLAARGFLHASHFCYLMSQTSFGSYNKKSSKIVLIGSSHSQPLELFGNNEAIQCTEIYEYALALGNTAVSLANFQYFKYLYYSRLVDYGLAQEALQYCEVISKHINMHPAFYQHVLVKLVYDMSCQLKYADPHIQESVEEEVPDPDWLRALHTTLVQFEEGAIQCASGSVTPAFMGTAASSESGEVGMIMQGTDNGAGYHQDMYLNGTLNKQDSTQHYQSNVVGDQSQYMPQYGQDQYGYQQGMADMSQYHSGLQTHGSQVEHPTQYPTEQTQSGLDNQQQPGNSMYHQQHSDTNYQQDNGYQQNMGVTNYAADSALQWPDQNTQQTESNMTGHMGYDPTNHNQDLSSTTQNTYNPQGQSVTHTGHYQPYGINHHQPNFPSDVNLGESQTSTRTVDTHRSSLASTSSVSQQEEEEGQDTVDSGYTGQGIFDLQPTQQKIVAPPLRKRTISESSTGSAGGGSKPSVGNDWGQTDKAMEKKDNASLSKPKQSGSNGGGIWGKIGGLFTRNKNEMKLPDDKEPSIVWDPVQKRWIDKDADEADSAPPAPPPKDTDLSGQTPAPAPSMLGPVSNMPPPPAGANKYTRRKGLGARGQYVDVMNPKPSGSQQVPTSLFSTLPSVQSAPAIFNPSGGDTSSSLTGSQTSEPIPEEKSNTGYHIPSSHSQGGLSLPPSTENNDPSAPVQTSLPTMFNPAQFQNKQPMKGPQTGPGHRLSNRRVYPK